VNRRSKKQKKEAPKNIGLWIAVMAIFIGELFFYTWCRVQCVRTGYEITQVRNQYLKLNTVQYNLKIEIARLKSPERIVKKAKEELGLVMPTTKQMVIMP
jgi:cell division protein FtsL